MTNFWKSKTKLAVIAFVLASYILGNAIQAGVSFVDRKIGYSNSLLDHYPGPNNSPFREKYQTMIDNAFHNPPEDQIFNLCQTYANIRNTDRYIQTMLAYYAFFRGLAIALLIAAASLIFKSICDCMSASPIVWRAIGKSFKTWGFLLKAIKNCFMTWSFLLALLFLIGVPISFRRSNDYSYYFVDHVYRTFYVSYSLSEMEDKQKQTKDERVCFSW